MPRCTTCSPRQNSANRLYSAVSCRTKCVVSHFARQSSVVFVLSFRTPIFANHHLFVTPRLTPTLFSLIPAILLTFVIVPFIAPRLKVYPSARSLHKAWLTKRRMDHGQALQLDANAFRSTVIEVYVNPNRYLLSTAHFDRLPFFEWQHFFLILTHRLNFLYLPTSRGCRDCSRFRSTVWARP